LPFSAFIGAISGTRESKVYYEKFMGRINAVWWNIKNLKKTLIERKNENNEFVG
jgi:hypothetical protein